MSRNTRFGKPCMTNLPPELGRQIIDEILSAPPTDRKPMQEKSRKTVGELKRKMNSIKTEDNDIWKRNCR